MAAREEFQLETAFRFDPDNAAADAILMVIEDAFGRNSVRRAAADEDGWARATVRVAPQTVDARQVNWLHAQLLTLAKYLPEKVTVDCSDAEGRETAYELDPDAPPRQAPAAAVAPAPGDLDFEDEGSAGEDAAAEGTEAAGEPANDDEEAEGLS